MHAMQNYSRWLMLVKPVRDQQTGLKNSPWTTGYGVASCNMLKRMCLTKHCSTAVQGCSGALCIGEFNKSYTSGMVIVTKQSDL